MVGGAPAWCILGLGGLAGAGGCGGLCHAAGHQ